MYTNLNLQQTEILSSHLRAIDRHRDDLFEIKQLEEQGYVWLAHTTNSRGVKVDNVDVIEAIVTHATRDLEAMIDRINEDIVQLVGSNRLIKIPAPVPSVEKVRSIGAQLAKAIDKSIVEKIPDPEFPTFKTEKDV